MRSKLNPVVLFTLTALLATAGTAVSQGVTGELDDPGGGVDEAAVKFLPSTATSASSSIEVFDVEITNPSANPLLIDQIDLPPPMYPHPELGCGCDRRILYGLEPAAGCTGTANSSYAVGKFRRVARQRPDRCTQKVHIFER